MHSPVVKHPPPSSSPLSRSVDKRHAIAIAFDPTQQPPMRVSTCVRVRQVTKVQWQGEGKRGASLQGAQCDRLIDRLSSWRTAAEGAWHNYGRHWHCTSLAQRQAACNVRAAQGQRRKVNERGMKGERGRGDWVECQTRIWILKLVWPTDNSRWRWQWWRWVQGRHLLVVLRPPPLLSLHPCLLSRYPSPGLIQCQERNIDEGMLKSIKHAVNYEPSEEFSLCFFFSLLL